LKLCIKTNKSYKNEYISSSEKQVDNPYIAAEMDSAYVEFLRTHPEYEATGLLDEWRKTEYGRLDENKQIYLDYTGGGLYGVSQLRQHTAMLEKMSWEIRTQQILLLWQ
jgi:hypothetical protein